MFHNHVIGPNVRRCLLALLAAISVLFGCGGVGTGGTGAFASGPITGFGSIIVNGVRFDESNARVEDDDGGDRSAGELRLGMVVAIDSGEISSDASGRFATARRVRIGSELLGPVDSVDAAAGTLLVIGQRVRVDAATVFDSSLGGGLASLVSGSVVEVYGFQDATSGGVLATRVEPRTPAPAVYKVRGPIAQLESAARQFQIGTETFTYAGVGSVPGGLANGIIVRARVAATRDALGRWVVQSLVPGLQAPEDSDDAEVKGLVTQFNSASSFAVNGITVDASRATVEGGVVSAGARVEVEGRFEAGVLLARKIDIEDAVQAGQFELHGNIASLDPVGKTFTLTGRSEVIGYSRGDLVYEHGTAADLMVGRRIEVKGVLSPDRTRVDATKIEFDN